MDTESFVVRDRFKVPNAENAWAAIWIAAGSAGDEGMIRFL
jgi:hypothetical protein